MATNPKTNIFVSVKKWLFNLTGKPLPEGQDAIAQPVEPEALQEDSVATDIKMFKGLVGKGKEKINTLITPFAKKGITSATSASTAVRSSVDNKFLKNLVRAFLILFFTLILVFIAIYFFRMLKSENGITQTPGVSVTPPPFEPFKPSVYAEDPAVLKIEEDVNILERELIQTNIREDGIDPPLLDFDISF